MDASEQLTELEELLRRCRRDELLPLAEIVRVNAQGLGRDRLAAAVARTLRRRGGHESQNIVRGAGPPWPELVGRLARRCGVPPGDDVVETERRIVAWWLRKAWKDLPERERQALWVRLGQEGPAPDEPTTGLLDLRRAVGRRAAVGLGAVTAGMVVRGALLSFFGPLSGLLALWWLGRPKDHVLLPALIEVNRLRHVVANRLTIGVVGSPSVGKDAAVGAIFGLATGNVHPVAGSTKEVAILRVPETSALYVVNTPGLGDVEDAVDEEAREALEHIDVYLYVVNAQGGVQARELGDWRRIASTGRPALAVVNKIDTLREADRERYLADARRKLGAPEEDFVAAAFDPLPQLADAPIGVEAVRDWIRRAVRARGKDLDELPF